MTTLNPICVALDTPEVARAVDLARRLKPHIGYFKIGMEFFYAHGNAGYEAVAREGVPIFLDLKLHDIPNTVEQGLCSRMRLSPAPALINIHAQGGRAMLQAARKAIPPSTKLIAVTMLTSLSDQDCEETGHHLGASELAEKLAVFAESAGLDGVVCSARDLPRINAAVKPSFIKVTPGIRPEDATVHDQKRIATPKDAIAAGASILVIGRAITGSADPARAAQEIVASLS